MAAQWLMTDQELETKDSETDQEELFVFGYACKVFRDDEKAQYIDEGRHLIPWMGDDRLLIDRYDGRGHLYDLSQYDVSNVKAEHKVLSEEEKQIETLCDEERYLELHTDVAEKKMYEEEEWKRYYETLSEGYNAVGFSYDYQHQLEYEQSASAMIEEKPFVIPEEIQVPVGMIAPTTEKHHAIIEKTAKFIASHGIQMEIIIKTKQKDNSQFDFMHFDDEMNPYYKHLLQMIKSGKYKPKIEEKPTEEDDHDNEDHSHHHGYLHPSLMPRRVSPTPEVGVTVPMPKVSVHDTPYGQLIKSLKKTDEKHAEKSSKNSQKKTSEQHTEKGPPPPPPISSYMSESVYGPTHSGMPLPPGIEPVTLPSSNQPPPPGTDLAGPVLPRYRHRSEEEDDDELEASTRNIRPEGIVPPPPDVQPVIDRMAMYVAKNGEEFEIVVKSKRDTRFDFLHSWHTHFPYYNFKKNLELTEIQRLKKQADLEKPKGVSFSIKNKVKDQDTMALEKRQVFDNESSEDEKDGDIDGYRLTRSDVSGTATPIDGMFSTEFRNENKIEKITASSDRRLAEERLKDKLAVAAREKLAQASKEKQMKAERKRKVAMFVNMLKSTNQQAPGQSGDDNKDDQDLGPDISGTPLGSRSHTPINWDESTKDSTNGDMFSRSSKRSRDRSRSTTPRQFRRSPSPLQFSRSRRSRSRSPRRRRRSPTPPSAYSRMRRTLSRSPVRWGVPRPASPIRRRDRSRSPRYSRTRSRSPSVPNSRRRDRSRSPRSSRNKSPISSTRKRSRSRSPSRSKSTKKDRKSSPSSLLSSRSSKKSKKKKKSRSKSPSSRSKSSKKTNQSSPAEVVIINDDSPEINPAADTQVANEPLEEGEIDSRLSPVVEESSLSSRIPQLSDLQKSETEVIGRSSTPSNIEDHSNSSVTTDTGTESKPPEIQKNVSNYMLSRVRAIIKASRQAVLEEDGPLDDL